MNSESESADGRSGAKEESLDVNSFCTRLSNKLHVLLELKPFQVPARNAFCEREHLPRIPIRLVCVIDVSHSMAEPHGPHSKLSKLEEIKVFGHLLIHCARPEDHLGLVVFGTVAEVLFPLQKMNEEAKKKLRTTFDGMTLKGVTNMSAGIFLAIDQFNQAFGKKNRSTNDNILLFSDGMPNEGLTDSHELTREIVKRVRHVADECRFDPDYAIKFTTVGTGGFYPETLYRIGRLFGSGAFHHLGDESCLASDLVLPVLSLQETVLTGIHVTVSALNGVQFDSVETGGESAQKAQKESPASGFQFSTSAWEEYLLTRRHSTGSVRSHRTQSVSNQSKLVVNRSAEVVASSSFSSLSEVRASAAASDRAEGQLTGCEPKQQYLIHDLGIDTEKHLLLSLVLPKKHKKILKGKEVISVKIVYKDYRMTEREFRTTLAYRDLPPKESAGQEADLVATYKTIFRIKACSAFDRASALVAKLDRNAAVQVLERTIDEVREECEKLTADTCNEEDAYAELYKIVDPLLANLNRCRSYIGDYSVRWDDVWGRLKSLRSSLARETVTSPSIYADRRQMFMTEELQSKITEMMQVLNELELETGPHPADTGTIGNPGRQTRHSNERPSERIEPGEGMVTRV